MRPSCGRLPPALAALLRPLLLLLLLLLLLPLPLRLLHPMLLLLPLLLRRCQLGLLLGALHPRQPPLIGTHRAALQPACVHAVLCLPLLLPHWLQAVLLPQGEGGGDFSKVALLPRGCRGVPRRGGRRRSRGCPRQAQQRQQLASQPFKLGWVRLMQGGTPRPAATSIAAARMGPTAVAAATGGCLGGLGLGLGLAPRSLGLQHLQQLLQAGSMLLQAHQNLQGRQAIAKKQDDARAR